MEQLFCIFVESKYKKALQDHDALDPQDFWEDPQYLGEEDLDVPDSDVLDDLDSVALGGLDSDALDDLDSVALGGLDSVVAGAVDLDALDSGEQLDGLLEDLNLNLNQKLRN